MRQDIPPPCPDSAGLLGAEEGTGRSDSDDPSDSDPRGSLNVIGYHWCVPVPSPCRRTSAAEREIEHVTEHHARQSGLAQRDCAANRRIVRLQTCALPRYHDHASTSWHGSAPRDHYCWARQPIPSTPPSRRPSHGCVRNGAVNRREPRWRWRWRAAAKWGVPRRGPLMSRSRHPSDHGPPGARALRG